jgi:hypothetical protein
MSVLKLDPDTNDLVISNNALVVEDDLVAETVQRIKTRLRTNLGEWYQDPRIGFPWIGPDGLLGDSFRIDIFRTLIRTAVESDEAVDTVETLVVDYDAAERKAIVETCAAKLIDGSPLEIQDFILEDYL